MSDEDKISIDDTADVIEFLDDFVVELKQYKADDGKIDTREAIKG